MIATHRRGWPSARRVLLATCALAGLFPCAARASDGPTVPSFELKDVDGDSFRLADALGNGHVLIDFWATWCKPCLRELPHLDALREKYESRGLTVVAIATDDSRSVSKVKSYVKTHDYGFRVLLDSNQQVLRKLGGRNLLPYLVLLSPDGTPLYVHTGYRDGDERKLEERLIDVLGAAGETEADDETTEPGAGAESGATGGPETP